MTFADLITFPAIIAIGCLVTHLSIPLCRKLALMTGMMDTPDARRIHSTSTPRDGGIAVFGGFQVALAAVFLFAIPIYGENLEFQLWWKLALVTAAIFTVGVLDDWRGLSPKVKLGGQIFCAILAFSLGFRMNHILGYELTFWLDFFLSILWIVAIVNAFNLIDGLDGLASGVALIAALALSSALLLREEPAQALLGMCLVGSCFGFLWHNFHPARIFLGDSGSMFLGFIIAILALTTAQKSATVASVGVPLLAVGVPALDTLLAVWRRTLYKYGPSKSETASNGGIMHADTDHLHHRLLKRGFKQHQAALLLYAFSIFMVGAALVALFHHSAATGVFIISFLAGAYIIIRYLAKLELWHTGMILVGDIGKPRRSRLNIIVYPVLDVLILLIGLAASILLLRLSGITIDKENVFNLLLPLWVAIPFIFLVASKMYRRIWMHARLYDFFKLGCLLITSFLIAAAITSMNGADSQNKVLVLFFIFEVALVVPMMLGYRILPRVIVEMVAVCNRHSIHNNQAYNVVIYGTNTLGTLLAKQLTLPDNPHCPRAHLLGFIENDKKLRNCYVYGLPVFGDVDRLHELVTKGKVDKVILTVEPDSATRQRLLTLIRDNEIEVSRWDIKETEFT